MNFFSNCQITDKGVQIRVLFITRTIAFSDIKTIRKVPFWKVVIEGMNLFKPPLWTTGDVALGGVVLIETLKGGRVAISPHDADEFVRIVSGHLTISN